MGLVTVAEAADRLGVTPRQVQHLVAGGELRSLARGVVDGASVERLLAIRGRAVRQAWSEATAWGAVALLSGLEADWMGVSQRSRLRGRLRSLDAVGLVERTRDRAVVTRYAAHPSALERLRGELVTSQEMAPMLGLAATSAVDGYTTPGHVEGLVARYGLIAETEQTVVTVRATTMDLATIEQLAHAAPVLAALDVAESLDVRERRAGLTALDEALEALRG